VHRKKKRKKRYRKCYKNFEKYAPCFWCGKGERLPSGLIWGNNEEEFERGMDSPTLTPPRKLIGY